ncbi:hypothetical protein KUCAC02_020391, partial [Chaenocephalus aceratus]
NACVVSSSVSLELQSVLCEHRQSDASSTVARAHVISCDGGRRGGGERSVPIYFPPHRNHDSVSFVTWGVQDGP